MKPRANWTRWRIDRDGRAVSHSLLESTRGNDAAPAAWVIDDAAAAFAQAVTVRKPLFLFWTAAWCPPCQEMRGTVLRHETFARQAPDFVMAELNGDAPGAQVWAERLGLTTYPTMLVLSPDGA